MASRVIAGLVLVAGVLALATVGFGGNEEEPVDTASTASAPIVVDDPVPETESGAAAAADPTTTTTVPELDIENFGPRPDLVNLDGWRNTDLTSIDGFGEKVLLVEMWTFGCHNCQARIPHNQELYASTSRDDFEIIGVHAPEFDREAIIANIEDAIERLGVTWPVALDTRKENFRAWQEGGRRFWPRTYIVDQNGDIRYDHIGEGRYEEVAETVQYLIDNPPAATTS